MKFVFDTNVLVSAVLKPESVPSLALSHAQTIGKLVFSSVTLAEFKEVINRPKFKKYLPDNIRKENSEYIFNNSVVITKVEQFNGKCRDEKDVKFLQIARTEQVSCIISGDNDLLVLHPFEDIPILTPSNFLKEF